MELLLKDRKPIQNEFRVKRPNGEVRWCIGTAAPSIDGSGRVARISGVTVDITDRKIAEERQALLAREVDHRAKNALALVQSIVRLTRASDIAAYTDGGGRAGSGRCRGRTPSCRCRAGRVRISAASSRKNSRRTGQAKRPRSKHPGPNVSLQPAAAQSLALALHELVTNAAKYGALSSMSGRVHLAWELNPGTLVLAVDGKRRPADAVAVVAGLWDEDHHRQHRRTTGRPDRVRLASGRVAMRSLGSARGHGAGQGAQWTIEPGGPADTAKGQSRSRAIAS